MNNTIDITTLSITKLKALAYDQLAILNRTQEGLQIINGQINKLEQANKSSEAPDTTVESPYPTE